MKITIIGGGGNTAEVTGAMLMMRGHTVNFYRFPFQIPVKGTPLRPTRSLKRLSQIDICPTLELSDYTFDSKAIFIQKSEIIKSDIIIIAMPAYMMERLPSLLPFVFSNKIVISLCERFHNTLVFFRGLEQQGMALPRIMISHRSDPYDANKTSKEGSNRLWRVKKSNDYYITPSELTDESLSIMEIVYGSQSLKWKCVNSLWDISFQNLNAISHAVTDLYALKHNKFKIGTPHYTVETYTPKTVEMIKNIIKERDMITNRLMGCVYPSLEEHESKSYGAQGLLDILGTNIYRYENSILKNRPAPEWYRASGFEDVGWSITPMEELAIKMNIDVPYTTSLINAWNNFAAVDYRKIGRRLDSIIYTLPNINLILKI